MFLHGCFNVDVFLAMFFSIDGVLLEIDNFYHRCFTNDVLLLIIDFVVDILPSGLCIFELF